MPNATATKKTVARRSDEVRAAELETKANELRKRVAIRKDKTLTKMKAIRARLSWLVEQVNDRDQELSGAAITLDELLGKYIDGMALQTPNTPALPFEPTA